jgi:hypothetical protein
MCCDFDEHGELSNRYKDLWSKKSLISWKVMENMTFDNEAAKRKFNLTIGDEIDHLSDELIDLLSEHLQIPPNVFTEVKKVKKIKCS